MFDSASMSNFIKVVLVLVSFALLIEVWILIHDRINRQRSFEGLVTVKYHDSTQRSPYYLELKGVRGLISVESDIFKDIVVGDYVVKVKGTCTYKVVKNAQDTLYYDKEIQ